MVQDMTNANENLWLWEPQVITATQSPAQQGGPSTCDVEESFFKKPVLNNDDGEDITDDARDATKDALLNRTKFDFQEPNTTVVQKGITKEMGEVECRKAFAASDAMTVRHGLSAALLSCANNLLTAHTVRVHPASRHATRCFRICLTLKSL